VEEISQRRATRFVMLAKHSPVDQIKKKEMDCTRGA